MNENYPSDDCATGQAWQAVWRVWIFLLAALWLFVPAGANAKTFPISNLGSGGGGKFGSQDNPHYWIYINTVIEGFNPATDKFDVSNIGGDYVDEFGVVVHNAYQGGWDDVRVFGAHPMEGNVYAGSYTPDGYSFDDEGTFLQVETEQWDYGYYYLPGVAASQLTPDNFIFYSDAPSLIDVDSSLTANPSPASWGQPVTVTMSVTPFSGEDLPTGTVTFKDNGSFLGIAALSQVDVTSVASLVVSNLSVYGHLITAEYAGDELFNGDTNEVEIDIEPSAQDPLTLEIDPEMAYGTTNSLACFGGSGTGAITYSVVDGPGLIVNRTNLVITGAYDTVWVEADKEGDGDYYFITAWAPVETFPAIASVTGIVGNDKHYDGSAAATLNYDGASLHGVVAGDVLSLSTSEVSASFADPYIGTEKQIIFSGLFLNGGAAENYMFVPQTTTFGNITPAPVTVTVTNLSYVYDGTAKAATVSTEPDTAFTVTYNGSAAPPTNAGTYVVFSTVTDSNYVGSASNNLVIAPLGMTVAASNQSRLYGAGDPAFTGSVTGPVSGDGMVVTFAPVATISSPIGTYDITPVISDPLNRLSNYTVTTNKGQLSVNPAPLNITATNQIRPYGQPNAPLGLVYTGFVNSDTASRLSTAAIVGTEADQSSLLGSYPITVSGAASSNYSITFSNGTLTVTKGSLTVTGNSTNRAYGQDNPAFTATITGAYTNDNLAALFNVSATLTSPPGSYKIALTVDDALGHLGEYDVVLRSGTLTVNPATLTGQIQNVTRTYGEANPAFSVQYSGFAPKEDAGVLSGTATFRCVDSNGVATGTNTAPGTYPITIVNRQTSADYSIQYTNGTLTVLPAQLLVGGVDTNRNYGAENPALSATISGFVNGEDSKALSGALLVTAAATVTNSAGTYAIVPSGLASTNYAITFSNGVLTVNPALTTLTVSNASKTYGQENPGFAGGIAPLLNGDNITVSLSTAATISTPAGPYPIQATLVDPASKLGNYLVSTNAGTLTINSATLLARADDQTRAYGATNPLWTVTYSGFVNGDSNNVVLGSPIVGTVADTNTPVGNSPITITLGELHALNYTFNLQPGQLAVTQAVITVAADYKRREYGTTNPLLTVTYSGTVNNESTNVIQGAPDISTSADITSQIGSYDIVVTNGMLWATNYSFQFVNNTLSVGRALLVVTADDQRRSYGAANPTLTFGYSGFKTNDNESILSGAPTVTTSATNNSIVGTYPIQPTVGTLTVSNYDLAFSNGTMTVTQALLTVTATGASRVYGAANPTLTGSSTATAAGDDLGLSFTTEATTDSPIGGYPITPLFANESSRLTNYIVTTNPATLTINPAALSVTASNATKVYGAPLPTFAGGILGTMNSDVISETYATTADATSAVGGYPIWPLLSGASLSNYTITTNVGSLEVTKAALLIRANNQTRPYGQKKLSYSFSYLGFTNGDTVDSLSRPPTASTTATNRSWIGTYPITPSGASADNYSLSYSNGTLTVTKAQLMVIGDDAGRAFGAPDPEFTADITGLVDGDGMTPVFDSVATRTSLPGPYDIELNLSDPLGRAGLYNITLIGGTLYITNAVVTGTVVNVDRNYGDTNPVLTVNYSGFANEDTSNILGGLLQISCLDSNGVPVDTNTTVGVYALHVVSAQYAPSYDVQYFDGKLRINPAALLVVPDDKSRVYGTNNPPLTAHYTGFVNNEDTNAIKGEASLEADADIWTAVGTYDINAGPGTLGATNYTFNYTNGTLTIGKALLSIIADNQERTYGAVNPTLTWQYAGFVDKDDTNVLHGLPSITTTADTNTPPGGYVILATNGALTATNYAFAFSNATLTIDKATLTATAEDQERLYGGADPEFTISYTGWVNGQGPGVIESLPTATPDADVHSGAGSYNINVGGGSDSNYDIEYGTGTLYIDKAPLTATADSHARLYGSGNPELTITYDGFVNGDTNDVLKPAPTASVDADAFTSVGHYSITLEGGYADNYEITSVPGDLDIQQVTLYATADEQERNYGDGNPDLTISYKGFVNKDGPKSLEQQPRASVGAAQTASVGSYPIILNGGVDRNYSFVLQNDWLYVDSIELDVVANDYERDFGSSNPTSFSGNLYGLVNHDPITATFHCEEGSGAGAGNYDIWATLSDPEHRLGNYYLEYWDGTLYVDSVTLTATVANASRLYGEANPSFSISYDGFVNGDTSNSLSGSLSYSCVDSNRMPTGANTAIGQYTIHASGQYNDNYSIEYIDGTLSVNPATLLIIPDDKDRLYGQTNPVFTATYSGYVNNEDSNVVVSLPELTTIADTNSLVGTYDITVVEGTAHATNYTFAYTNGTLTVGKAQVSVIADNQERTYGAENPTLTWQYRGFVDNDDTNVLHGLPSITTLADTNTPPGTYVILATNGELRATNYAFAFSNATLTIDKATLTATANDQERLYGGTEPEFTISYTGFVNGQGAGVITNAPTATPSASVHTGVGSYDINISGGSDSNYAFEYAGGTLTIDKAPLTLTAESKTRSYGSDNPELTITYDGFVNGDTNDVLKPAPTPSVDADATTPVGHYAITLDGCGADNYEITLKPGDLSIEQVTLTAKADYKRRVYGQENPKLTISYKGFVNKDCPKSLENPPVASTLATNTSPVARYAITLSPGSDRNYNIVPENGVLEVTPAELTITANAASRPYGTENPEFGGTISGLQNGDPISATYGANANIDSPAGLYTITPSLVDLSDLRDNYSITYISAPFNITAALTLSLDKGFYVIGDDPTIVDANAAVADGGSLNFAGATLTVGNVLNASVSDELAMETVGWGPGQISVDQNAVSYGGQAFATFTNDGEGLSVIFGSNPVTSGMITALMRQVSFATDDTNTAQREIQVVLGYGSNRVAASRTLTLDRSPVANDMYIVATKGANISIPISDVLTNASDADNDPINLGAISFVSANRGRVTTNGTSLLYRPSTNTGISSDLISYLVMDGRGGEGIGVIVVQFVEAKRLEVDATDIDTTGVELTMGANPGGVYDIQASTDLINWTTIETVRATSTGVVEVLDSEAKSCPHRFYRAVVARLK